MRYNVNTPRVIHETIDEETIVIDLTTGSYFSLRDTAAAAWAQIVEGNGSPESLSQAVAAQYSADAAEVEAALRAFLEELQSEQLVVVSQNGNKPPDSLPLPDGGRGPFTAPRVEKYTDMQDIILLDPVHNVGASGWPDVAPAGGG